MVTKQNSSDYRHEKKQYPQRLIKPEKYLSMHHHLEQIIIAEIKTTINCCLNKRRMNKIMGSDYLNSNSQGFNPVCFLNAVEKWLMEL